MQATQLIAQLAPIAANQSPVVVQVHAGHGLELTALAVGALAGAGLICALAGVWLLLARTAPTHKGGKDQ